MAEHLHRNVLFAGEECAAGAIGDHRQPSIRFELRRRAGHNGRQNDGAIGRDRKPLRAIGIIGSPAKVADAGRVIATGARRIVRWRQSGPARFRYR